jgi:transcriptional regulator with XRE-family HTH domain
MIIGERLKVLREQKKISQGDIEKRTGLLRCYISRVENGHTVPALETLEKLANAMDVPLYQVFVADDETAPKGKRSVTGATGADDRFVDNLKRHVLKMSTADRKLLATFAAKLAKR